MTDAPHSPQPRLRLRRGQPLPAGLPGEARRPAARDNERPRLRRLQRPGLRVPAGCRSKLETSFERHITVLLERKHRVSTVSKSLILLDPPPFHFFGNYNQIHITLNDCRACLDGSVCAACDADMLASYGADGLIERCDWKYMFWPKELTNSSSSSRMTN